MYDINSVSMTEIPGYTIIEDIGVGGWAVVWKAHQLSLDRIVAIKILRSQYSSSEKEVESFVREARSIAKLKHPNIVQIYDVGQHESHFFFVMEFINGSTALKILRDEGPIPQKKCLKIALSVAEALSYGWDKQKMIHLDVKPENIMIDEDGTVKISDLGLARISDPSQVNDEGETEIAGTPNYMSPEQVQGAHLDFRSDMYSLGATLYHMVTGSLPFGDYEYPHNLTGHIESFIPNPRDINPSISIGMANLISRLMMKNPDDRYPSWNHLIKDMKHLLSRGVLISKKRSSSAVSTVDIPTFVTPDAAPTKLAKEEIPSYVSVPAWIILFLWLMFHTFENLKSLRYLAQESQQRPSSTRQENVIIENETDTDVPIKPDEVISNVEVDERIDPYSIIPNPEELLFSNLKKECASLIINKQFPEALSLIEKEKELFNGTSYLDKLASIEHFINTLSTKDDRVRSFFREKTGKEVTIFHNGRDIKIKLIAMSGDKVSAEIISDDDSSEKKIVSFFISKFDPIGQIKLLGEPKTDGDHGIAFFLYLQAGDLTSAVSEAEHCGVLSEELKNALTK